jgi:osmotically-inducible protein OsmY
MGTPRAGTVAGGTDMFGKKLGSVLGAAAIAMMTVACSASDPGLTTAVKSKLAADDTVKAYRIDVDTKDAVVTLNGEVDTPMARERAVELARGTEGVRDVVDNLTVSPGATPTTGVDDVLQREAGEAGRAAGEKTGDAMDRTGDAAANAVLTTKVKTKFLADDDVSGLKIDVDSNNGVVTLTGTVPTAAEKALALKLAKETEGVKSVVDRLKVGK